MNPFRRLIPFTAETLPAEVRSPRSWHLSAEHSTIERARVFAELALMPIANDQLGLTDGATARIADAMERYARLDAERNARNDG